MIRLAHDPLSLREKRLVYVHFVGLHLGVSHNADPTRARRLRRRIVVLIIPSLSVKVVMSVDVTPRDIPAGLIRCAAQAHYWIPEDVSHIDDRYEESEYDFERPDADDQNHQKGKTDGKEPARRRHPRRRVSHLRGQ